MTGERPLASDTPLEVERVQIEIWRRMTPAQKLQAMGELNDALARIAEAGIRLRYPQASDREVFLRRAALTLGAAKVRELYGFDVEAGE